VDGAPAGGAGLGAVETQDATDAVVSFTGRSDDGDSTDFAQYQLAANTSTNTLTGLFQLDNFIDLGTASTSGFSLGGASSNQLINFATVNSSTQFEVTVAENTMQLTLTATDNSPANTTTFELELVADTGAILNNIECDTYTALYDCLSTVDWTFTNGLAINGDVEFVNALGTSGEFSATGIFAGGDLNVLIGAGEVITTGTDGFPHISTTPGVPTGVPTTFTGFAPIVLDSTSNALYVYNEDGIR
jgi:hypothetical protein